MIRNFFACWLVLLTSCTETRKNAPITEKIAQAHGLTAFNKAETIEFTFNVQRDTAAASNRHWVWHPKINQVEFLTDSGNTKFTRYDTTTPELKKLNARFTNDEYWLLYPFHLSWDKGYSLVDSGMRTAPISGKRLRMLTIKYNATDGFTPGDWYDVYADEENIVQEWGFHKKGAPEASLVTTWEEYKEFEGMKIAQEHKSKDGKFRLWFTGVKVNATH